MENFNHLQFGRTYALHKDDKLIFHFTIDSSRNFKILSGKMNGYLILPENQLGFIHPEFTIIDIGEAPTVATIKVDKVKGRPRTPENN